MKQKTKGQQTTADDLVSMTLNQLRKAAHTNPFNTRYAACKGQLDSRLQTQLRCFGFTEQEQGQWTLTAGDSTEVITEIAGGVSYHMREARDERKAA